MKKENHGPPSTMITTITRYLPCFILYGILKNSHLREKRERHLRCIRCAIVWTLRLRVSFLLKRKWRKKTPTSVSQSLRLKIKRISMFLLTSFQNGQQEAFKTSFIVWELNVKNNFALAIQLPRHRALSRYQGAIRKQAETWSADLARRWISYRWNQFLSTTLYRKFKEINSLALYIQSTLNFDPFS